MANNVVDKAISDLDAAQEIYDADLFVLEQANAAKSATGSVLKAYFSNGVAIPTKTSDLINDSNFVSDAAYVHTDNNYTASEKLKLSNIETNAEENVIVTVKVNGTLLTPDADRAVDVSVPTKTSDLTNDSKFISDAALNKAFIQRVVAGNPAAFDDGADDTPIKELVAEIDYAPGGKTSCTVNRAKKNLLPVNDVTFTGVKDDYISVPPIPAGTYTFSALVTSSDTDGTESLIRFLDRNFDLLASAGLIRNQRVSTSVVLSEDLYYIQLFAGGDRSTSSGDTATFADMQLEVGNTSTGYEPYSGQTYQINWADIAGTIYGGHLDVTTGLLTSTLNENGEELSEPVTYQLTPTEVRTFWGNNTIWADTGDVAVTYRADPTIEIDRKVDKTDYDPVNKTEDMTQPVGKDANGRLFTAPAGGAGGVKVGSITLSASWTGNDPYTQTVIVSGVTTTNSSLISIQPSNALLDQMETDGCKSLRIDNVNGVITAVARGAALTSALTIQVTVTEVTV